MLRIFAALVLSLITALNTVSVPCKAEETRHITIQFDGGGATEGTMETITLSDGNSAMAIPENKFERSGYLFSHWYITDGSNTYTALDGAIPHDFVARQGDYWRDYAKNSNTLTLIAQWECVVSDDYYEFTVPTSVTLNKSNDKLSTTINVKATAKERKWLKVGITSNNNFSLVGKTSKAKLPYTLSETSFEMSPQYPIGTDTEETDKTLTVNAKASDGKIADDYTDTVNFEVTNVYDTRTIVLDCNGGTVNGQSEISYTVRDGSSYGKLPVPTKTNYIFVGWKDESENTIYSGSIVEPNAEKLFAVYKRMINYSIACMILGTQTEGFQNVGIVDLYRNGWLEIQNSTSTQNRVAYPGDTVVIKNIRINEGYKFVGENKPKEGYEIITDENGNLQEINITFNSSSETSQGYYYLLFKKESDLQSIIDNNVINSVVFDADKPLIIKDSCGTLAGFDSVADTYIDGISLHVYNPNGGNVIAKKDSNNLFSYIDVNELDVSNLDVSQTNDFRGMFENCTASSILMDNWKTDNMVQCDNMFRRCSYLKNIDFSSWNTSKVISFSDFLAFCSSLMTVDVSNFDTSNCKSFFRMFGLSYNLQEIKGLENLKTSKSTNFAGMFQAVCMPVIDVSNFDTSSAIAMNYMFGSNSHLKKIIGLTSFDTSKVRTFNEMFQNCGHLTELDLSNFDMSCATNINNMFCYDTTLKTIYVSQQFENFTKNGKIKANILFANDYALVGGQGTVFDNTFVDENAARIDGGPNAPGYFTDIADKPLVATQSLENTPEDYTSEASEEDDFVPAPYSPEEISEISEN